MKTNTLRLIAFLLIAPLAAVTTGCVATKTAAKDTVSWVRGSLDVVLDNPLDRVGTASTNAVKNMKFSNVESKVDVVSGQITARTAQDTKIEILLTKVGEKTTQVSIRVGVFGDEALSRLILDEIKKNL